MDRRLQWISRIAVVTTLVVVCTAPSFSQTTRYVVTNDDNYSANSATFYAIGADGVLVQKAVIKTGGLGLDGGAYATAGVAAVRSLGCVYVSNSRSIPASVSGIVESTLTLAGTFRGSNQDSGGYLGVGLALGSKALYASFTGSGKIGVFALGPNCTLSFKKDVAAVGLLGGSLNGMKVRGNLLVVSYLDGSVSSFDISTGIPVPNGDLQLSSGHNQFGDNPSAVDISTDGHWAIFGDTSSYALVEIADISSGQIASTTPFFVGTGLNSSNVWLSPDNTLLYVSNNDSGQITAAFFDNTAGRIGATCMSSPLKNYFVTWFYTGAVITATATGTGKAVYVAEWAGGYTSGIAEVKVTSTGSSCALTETPSSPFLDPQSGFLLSLSTYPPREF